MTSKWFWYIRARIAETRADKALSRYHALRKKVEIFFTKAGL